MKKIFITFFSMLFMCPILLQARINVLEPWLPGQDSKTAKIYLYEPRASFLIGENFAEVPIMFTYVFDTKAEIGGRWGLKFHDDKMGINDLMLGLKYVILCETANKPAVIGELGVSLPTADSSNNMGTGAVGFATHWAIEKKINDLTGYFGLGITLNCENKDEKRVGNVFYYHIGAGYPYTKYWTIFGHIKGFNHGKTKQSGVVLVDSYQELYLAPGLDYKWSDKTIVTSCLLIGLTPESNDLGMIFSINF